MSVHHIVLLGFNDDVAEAAIVAMSSTINGLIRQIPGVTDVKWGRDFSVRTPNVTHVSVVTLTDRQALAGYAAHPKHLEALGILKPNIKHLSVVDFEA